MGVLIEYDPATKATKVLKSLTNEFGKPFASTALVLANDADADGVSDELDLCPNTPSGESVDVNGCSESQKDEKNKP